jgi:DNA-binding NarL/FixJ family response regulator
MAIESSEILIVDDHAMFRSGLSLLLRTSLEAVQVIEAGSLDEALRASIGQPAVILLDVHLQAVSGLECIVAFALRWPQAAILVLSADATDATIALAKARGAAAFIAKTSPATVVVDAVRQVLGGMPRVSAVHCSAMADDRLTPRQCQVLDLLCQGLPNKTIGRRLDLSENTVRGHVQAILAFLQVCSRTEAVVEARRRGLVA